MRCEQDKQLFGGDILRNRYKIIHTISNHTGFGITYLAEDLDLPNNHKCVVKQLNRQKIAPDILDKATELFKRESKCLYKLGNHKQIPSLYASFEENDEFYLVQEFIDGKSLNSEIIPNQPWSEAQAIEILQGILEILAFVHKNKSIHRDVKPANIMRRKHNQKLVLIDFGAVKEINTLKNCPQIITGTTPYAPSEQYKGNPVLASDIFAVGVIGIMGLTGGTYYQDRDNIQNLTISAPFAKILKKMTHSNWKQRYQNTNEVLTEINQTIVIPTSAPTFWEKTKNWWNYGTFE